MHEHQDTRGTEAAPGGLIRSRAGLVLIGFLAVGGVLMFTEHLAHVLGAIYWLLPLGCLFMHMFMHRGHHGHRHHHEEGEGKRR